MARLRRKIIKKAERNDEVYRVREICLMEGQRSNLACHNKVYSGDYLMKAGLMVLGRGRLTSHIIELTKE